MHKANYVHMYMVIILYYMQDDINKQPNNIYIVLQLLTIQSCSYNMHHVIQHDCTHKYNMQGEEESIHMHAKYRLCTQFIITIMWWNCLGTALAYKLQCSHYIYMLVYTELDSDSEVMYMTWHCIYSCSYSIYDTINPVTW